nr:hypothetical protein GCM10025730_07690 [Promicromonospora thailandica]
MSPELPPVVIPSVVLSAERDRNQLVRDRRSGDIVRVRRGAYCAVGSIRTDGPAAGPRERRNRALACARALHAQLRADHVFSHATAALLLGCRVWTVPDRTHLYQGYRASARAADDVVRHRGDLPPRIAPPPPGCR